MTMLEEMSETVIRELSGLVKQALTWSNPSMQKLMNSIFHLFQMSNVKIRSS